MPRNSSAKPLPANFNFVNETSATLPRVAFARMKKEILGEKYELTLVIANSAEIKKLNTIYRDKKTPTDILSFPLSKFEGEMYISPVEAKKEAKKFGRSYENFLAFLFIHGCVHLKGYDHGGTMERIEMKFRKKFKV